MLKKRAPILGALFIVCERRISCPQDEFENKKYAQADIFCALRKLKPVLADFLLTQDEKQKSIKTARHKIPHEKFWHIGEAHLLLYGKDYKRVFAPNAAPCAWAGAFYRRSLSGRIFTSSLRFWAHCFLQTKVASGECTTIMSSTPSRAVARPAASNTRQSLESFA